MRGELCASNLCAANKGVSTQASRTTSRQSLSAGIAALVHVAPDLNMERLPFRQSVARETKAVIPLPYKRPDKIAEACNRHKFCLPGDFSPGMHAGLPIGKGFKRDPLLHCITQGVVNPCHMFARCAYSNHVVYCGFYGAHNFNLQPASWRPGLAFAPADISINIAKLGPETKIRK